MEQTLLDKYREINVNYDDWYEPVYSWFLEYCREVGVEVGHTRRNGNALDIVWSGFWSQGDGAAFSGSVDDLEKAIVDLPARFPITYKYVSELKGWYRFTWDIGRGNHIILHSLEIEDIGLYLPEGDQHPFAEIWSEQMVAEVEIIEAELGDLAGDLCGTLYKALQDEYYALTSDEAVWDAIVANDLHLEEEVA